MEVFSMLSVVSHAYGCSSHGGLWLGDSAGLLWGAGAAADLLFVAPFGENLRQHF